MQNILKSTTILALKIKPPTQKMSTTLLITYMPIIHALTAVNYPTACLQYVSYLWSISTTVQQWAGGPISELLGGESSPLVTRGVEPK